MKKQTLGRLQIAFAAILWGSLGLFGKKLNELGMSSVAIVTIRIGIAFIALSSILKLKNNFKVIRKRDLPLLIIYSFLSVILYNIFYFSTIERLPISVASILLYLSPFFVIILSALLLKEKISLRKIIASIIAFLGIVLVIRPSQIKDLDILGVTLGFMSAITFSLYSVLGKKLNNRYQSLTVVSNSFGLGFLGLLIYSIVTKKISLQYSTTAWIYVIILGIGPTLTAFILYNSGLKKIKASEASIISTLEPIVAVLLGTVILKENLLLLQIIGILLVLAGIVVISLEKEV
jgi:drug/metabolite transporter (DMT)-like permease